MRAFRCFEHMDKIQDVHCVPRDAQRAPGTWNRVLAGRLTGKVSYVSGFSGTYEGRSGFSGGRDFEG